MTTFATTLGTVVVTVSFWGAVATIALSAVTTLSKVFARHRNGGFPPSADRGIHVLAMGLIGATALVFLPSISLMATTATDTVEKSAPHHQSALEYVAALPGAAIWVITAAINLWLFALVSTLGAMFLRRRHLRRFTAE